jgi:glycerol transport system substrate-binding protein
VTLRIGAACLALAFTSESRADTAAAKRWVDKEFQPSTLTKEQQMKEMEWFINRRQTLQGHGDQRALGDHSDARV